MASYATLAQWRSWFAGTGKRVSDYLQPTDTATQDIRIQEALNSATAVIDGYLKHAYSIPIDTSTAPYASERADFLKMRCIELANEELGVGVPALPEGVEERKSRAVVMLEQIQGVRAWKNGRLTFVNPRMDLPGLSRTA